MIWVFINSYIGIFLLYLILVTTSTRVADKDRKWKKQLYLRNSDKAKIIIFMPVLIFVCLVILAVVKWAIVLFNLVV